jgi:hypothetical protein
MVKLLEEFFNLLNLDSGKGFYLESLVNNILDSVLQDSLVNTPKVSISKKRKPTLFIEHAIKRRAFF